MQTQDRKTNGHFGYKQPNFGWKTFVSFVVGIFFLVWFIPIQMQYNRLVVTPLVEATTTPKVIDMTPEKINKAENRLLDELSLGCEAKNAKEPYSLIIFDSNNEASLGGLQFQIKTVQYYAKKFYGKNLNRHDAIVLALDEKEARELARHIIFEEKGGLENNWVNCSSRLQLVKEVETIKTFMSL